MKKQRIKDEINFARSEEGQLLIMEEEAINRHIMRRQQKQMAIEEAEKKRFGARMKSLLYNKKAQGGFVAVIFLLLIFILNWAIWLGAWLADIGAQTIVNQKLTGVEAFFYGNLNLWVMIAAILGTLGFLYFGGGQ